jgi:hypothetical protein
MSGQCGIGYWANSASALTLNRLLGLTTKDTVTQQLDLFGQIPDVSGNLVRLKQHLLEKYRVVWKSVGQWSHAPDYTCQAKNLGVKTLCGRLRQRSNPSSNQFNSCTVRTIASSVSSGDVLKRSDSRRWAKTKAIALPVQNFDPVAVAIQENKKHRAEHGDFDIQSTRAARPSMDFRKSTGFG